MVGTRVSVSGALGRVRPAAKVGLAHFFLLVERSFSAGVELRLFS